MEAALIAAHNVPIAGARGSSVLGKPRAPRTRNPITGEVPESAKPLAPSGSSSSLGTFGSQAMLFPPRGTFGGAPPVRTSPHHTSSRGARKVGKLEFEVWCEEQKRIRAERELRNVIIRGRSRPPWVGDSESSGYQSLYPQTR